MPPPLSAPRHTGKRLLRWACSWELRCAACPGLSPHRSTWEHHGSATSPHLAPPHPTRPIPTPTLALPPAQEHITRWPPHSPPSLTQPPSNNSHSPSSTGAHVHAGTPAPAAIYNTINRLLITAPTHTTSPRRPSSTGAHVHGGTAAVRLSAAPGGCSRHGLRPAGVPPKVCGSGAAWLRVQRRSNQSWRRCVAQHCFGRDHPACCCKPAMSSVGAVQLG